MSFWTSQQLEARLPHLIKGFSSSKIDCNAYTLTVGDQIYVSPTDRAPDPSSVTIRRIDPGGAFVVPPGQFAFLITSETIRVPIDAMAFISMKAKLKFRGLVNVSGFHVDPGYEGKLVFSVFNAGPTDVHLCQGQDCFLIWYSSLEGESEKHKIGIGSTAISTDLINTLPGEVQSFAGLLRKLSDVEERLTSRLNVLEPKQAALDGAIRFTIGLLVAFVVMAAGVVIKHYW